MNEDAGVDFIALGKIGLSAKWRILGYGLIAASVAFAASFLFEPVFSAEILVLNSPAERRGGDILSSLGGGAGGLSALINPNSDSNTQEAVAILKSRALIDAFIADNNLLPILFKERWDAKTNQWKNVSSWFDDEKTSKPTDGDAYELFNKKIRRVEEDRKSGLVTLSIEWSDPQQAADWAGELIDRANALLRNTAIMRAEKSLDFLGEEIKKTGEIGVREAIYKLIDSELKREMFAKVNEDYAFKVIDPAKAPEKKIRPKRVLFTAFGFILGATVAFALALRRRALS